MVPVYDLNIDYNEAYPTRHELQTAFNFKHFISFIAVPRSAHHSVPNWVFLQLPRPSLMLWKGIKVNLQVGKVYLTNSAGIAITYYQRDSTGDEWKQMRKENELDSLLYGQRDFDFIGTCYEGSLASEVELVEPEQPHHTKVILLRDYPNWWSSYSRRWGYDPNCSEPMKPAIARNLAAYEEHLRLYLDDDPRYVFIKFPDWFKSIEYRKEIARKLSIQYFTDAGLNKVHPLGSGSSFTHLQYDGEAQKMPVMNRWQECSDFPHPHLEELSKEVFGDTRL
jgi:hypothetical protein